MKVAIASNPEGNLEASLAFWDDARVRSDSMVLLGDIVGFGPNPKECLDFICQEREAFELIMAGDHEYALLYGKTPARGIELAALRWTIGQLAKGVFFKKLDPKHQKFLEGLPTQEQSISGYGFVHGAPSHEMITHDLNLWSMFLPESMVNHLNWGIIGKPLPMQPFIMESAFRKKRAIYFVGNSHQQGVLERQDQYEFEWIDAHYIKGPYELEHCAAIHVGSVGITRTGEALARYAILDTDRACVEFRQVPYRSFDTARKMLENGKPIYNGADQVAAMLTRGPVVR